MPLVILIVLAALLLAAGGLLWWWSRRLDRLVGLPAGKVVYSDTGVERALTEPLLSTRHGLVGKPDYLLEVTSQGQRQLIPVEVKSRRRPLQPMPAHVMQLGAYCLLVEDVLGQRPSYGLLRYRDDTVAIPFSENLRRSVIEAAEAIRCDRTAALVRRSHADAQRCRACGYRDSCGSEALG